MTLSCTEGERDESLAFCVETFCLSGGTGHGGGGGGIGDLVLYVVVSRE